MMPYTANHMAPFSPHIGTARDPIYVAGAALAGLLLGSFLNVCIARLPLHQSVVWPGSHCPRCRAPIRPADNIPLLSWLILQGRCRACGERISLRYPAVELSTALLFVLSLLTFGLSADGVSAAVFCFLALGLLMMDLETMMLPDAFTLSGIALGIVHATLVAAPPLVHRLTGAGDALLTSTAGALLMLAIRWAYWLVRRRPGLGLGDVKLLAMIAAWLGALPTLLTFTLAALAASITGLAALGLRSRLSKDRERLRTQQSEHDPASWQTLRLPLGTFLCASALLVLFRGRPILDWYMGFFR